MIEPQQQHPEVTHLASKPATAAAVVFLLDWDDSILPSSWLNNLSKMRIETAEQGAEVAKALYKLEYTVICLLRRLLTLGSVCLVTNAQTGWVELSCSKYLPNVLPLLAKTKIVSARSQYEHINPQEPALWKLAAFRNELQLDSEHQGDYNIVSFGDSLYELDAMRCIAEELRSYPLTLVKTIKLMERPDITELNSQLEILLHCMQDVVNYSDHLDLCLAPQQKQQEVGNC